MTNLDIAKKISKILGPSSAAAKALARYEELKSAGHETEIILHNNTWLVREPA